MVSFTINEIVQVSNKKGRRSTIHISNITSLSWHELQLLVSEGSDKFTKMVLLYRGYASKNPETIVNGISLTDDESREIYEYVNLFRNNNCKEHYEVNKIISNRGDWDNFRKIRSLNDHGEHKEIEGIQPKYFEIICHILDISGAQGEPLNSYKKY